METSPNVSPLSSLFIDRIVFSIHRLPWSICGAALLPVVVVVPGNVRDVELQEFAARHKRITDKSVERQLG